MRISRKYVLFGVVFLICFLYLFQGTEDDSVIEMLSNDVTLVTHLSLERCQALEVTLGRWRGPVAIAIWLKDLEKDNKKFQEMLKRFEAHPSKVHYVTLRYHKLQKISFISSSKYTYPANILRNRALQLVETKLAFVVDADYVPDGGLYDYITSHFDNLFSIGSFLSFVSQLVIDTVYIMPHFQFSEDSPSYLGQVDSFLFPADKNQLLERIASNSMTTMLSGIDDIPFTRATNVPKWYKSKSLYSIRYEDNYEPNFIAPTQHIPHFDERFIYYGYDKIQVVVWISF
jgi:glycosyltransferase-like protein LARGE